MRALVTGATGMLGSHMVERLLGAGISVRAFVRTSSDICHLRVLPVEIIRGEATDQAAISRAVAGCHLVFHVAAYLNLGSAFNTAENFDRYRRINVDFTRALLEASWEAGLARFVYTSSTSVYSVKAPAPIAENALLDPVSNYGRSKVLAEEQVRDYQERGLATTIVRPCIMYGPRDRHFTPAALSLVRLPILPLIDGGRYLYDLVYVGDVTELMWQASQSEIAIGKVYNAASSAPLPLREFIKIICEQTGKVPWVCSSSSSTVQRFAGLARLYLKKLAPGAQAFLTPAGLLYLGRDVYYDVSQATRDLNHTPKFSLRQGFALTLAYQ